MFNSPLRWSQFWEPRSAAVLYKEGTLYHTEFLVIYSKQPILGLTQDWSISELGIHDRLYIYILSGILYFPSLKAPTGYSVSSERHRQCGGKQTCPNFEVAPVGFEPATTRSSVARSNHLCIAPHSTQCKETMWLPHRGHNHDGSRLTFGLGCVDVTHARSRQLASVTSSFPLHKHVVDDRLR